MFFFFAVSFAQAEEQTSVAPVMTAPVISEKITSENLHPNELEQKKEDDLLVFAKGKKFIYLTLGVEHEEKYKDLPAGLSPKGDFRKITHFTQDTERKLLKFNPTSEGTGTLTLHDKKGNKVVEYRLVVKKSKLDTVAREMQSLLGDIEGISIKIVNNKVVVDGQILLPRDYNRIFKVVKEFGENAANFVTMSPVAMKKIAEYIAREINNPEIEVKTLNDKILLTGKATTNDEKTRAVIIAKSYIPPIIVEEAEGAKAVLKKPPANDGVVDLIEVPPQPQAASKLVQVVVHYVELSKDYNKAFRFQFMPSLKDDSSLKISTGSNTDSSFVSEFTTTINNLLPKLNWLKSHGHARVLESTTILVKEGTAGSISSKRKFPQAVVLNSGQQTTTGGEDIGISSTITPTISGERSDTIDLDVTFDISAPAGQTSSGLIVANNKIKTIINVRNTQSAAIGGLIQNNSTTAYNRLPSDVSANPIISLYASKDFTRGQSQFVVFVTPIIKSSASSGAEKIKKKFRLRD